MNCPNMKRAQKIWRPTEKYLSLAETADLNCPHLHRGSSLCRDFVKIPDVSWRRALGCWLMRLSGFLTWNNHEESGSYHVIPICEAEIQDLFWELTWSNNIYVQSANCYRQTLPVMRMAEWLPFDWRGRLIWQPGNHFGVVKWGNTQKPVHFQPATIWIPLVNHHVPPQKNIWRHPACSKTSI